MTPIFTLAQQLLSPYVLASQTETHAETKAQAPPQADVEETEDDEERDDG